MASSGLTACGSQGQSIHKLFVFQKSTDIDSPFTCVQIIVFQCGKEPLYFKRCFEVDTNLTLTP